MDKRINWATLDAEEKAQYFGIHILNSKETVYDYDLLQKCLLRIDLATRKLFVKNMLSETAHSVYQGLSQEQVQSEETMLNYYFHLLAADLDMMSKCLYWAVRGEGV